MNWKNLKIGTKLLAGFGISLSITALLSVIAVFSMVSVIARVEKSNCLNTIESSMLDARRHEKNFIIRNDNIYASDVKDALKIVYEQAEIVKDKFDHQNNKDEIDEMISIVKKYEEAFLQYVECQHKKDAAMEKMRVSSADVMNDIQQASGNEILYHYKAAISFTQARKAEKEFIICYGRDAKWFAEWKEKMTACEVIFKAANDNTILTIIDRYKTTFEEFIALQNEQNIADDKLVEVARNALAMCVLFQTDQQNKMLSETTSATNFIIFIAVFALILGVIAAVTISKSITKPLLDGVDFALQISKGNLMATVEWKQEDELGKLADALRTMISKMRETVSFIVSTSNNIGSASIQMSSGSQALSQGASEQASSTEEVSSSMEQMAANIQQNTDNAKQTEAIANQASTQIIDACNYVNSTVESMKIIASKISIINEIAFQTNILALNAAVEAARAGEHGKGFAVVASEVRKLAERSQKAAVEIDMLSKNSVDVAEKSQIILESVVPNIQNTAKMVQEITAASNEQMSGVEQINNAILQLNVVTQQNAASSEELATSSKELASQAEQLTETVSFFNVGEVENSAKSHKYTSKIKKSNHVNSFSNQKGTKINLSYSHTNEPEFERF